jgi:Protein of unknown function (DUF4232)
MPPDCHAPDLTLTRAGMGAGTFHYISFYALTNTSSSTCHLSGYPRLVPDNYPFRSPLRIHENTMWGGWLRYKYGHPVKAVTLSPGAGFDLAVGVLGNPDASAEQLRHCSRVAATRFKLLLPDSTRAVEGAPVTAGFCPTTYVGSDLYVSPILDRPAPSHKD